MVQVQLRVPEQVIKEIDEMVKKNKFRSRSDAIKTMISFYQEREKTKKFYEMLAKIEEETEKHPEMLVKLEKS